MPNYKFVAAILVAACMCNTAAVAHEDHGTPEQRAACTPDAFQFCGNYIPYGAVVASCLRQRKLDLSDACKAVFEPRATTSPIGNK